MRGLMSGKCNPNDAKLSTKQDGWKAILGYLKNDQTARNVSNRYICEAAKSDGLNTITELGEMAAAIPCHRSTLDSGSAGTRSSVIRLYAANHPACIAAINGNDAEALKKAYETLHKDHVFDVPPENVGKYAPGAGGKREAAEKQALANEPVGEVYVTQLGTPLLLEDHEDVLLPVSKTLGNVSVQLPKQRIAVGADGHLSATVRCHAAKWAGLSVAVTSCLLTLIPSREIKRVPHLPPLKETRIMNGRGDTIIVERVDRYTIRLSVAESPGKKPGSIGEVELPGELWALLDARAGDVFDCEMRVLLRDVSAEPEPHDTGIARASGDPLDDMAMSQLQKRFEEVQRVSTDDDGNTSALLHRPQVGLAPDKKD
jgi:hypothetical protein